MQGLLIVNHFLNTTKFTQLNTWIMNSAERKNISLSIFTNREIMNVSDEFLKKQDFILFWDKDIILAKKLEMLGCRLFNSSEAIADCDDKALTYVKLLDSGIIMPNTIILPMTFDNIGYTDTSFLKEAGEKLGYPLIIKERFGSFGMQVYKVDSYEKLEEIFNSKWKNKLILQEYISSSCGKDIRINVVGNKIITSMYRYSTDGDFRANITNGAKMKPYNPSKKERDIAIKACQELKLDFAGVDLLFGENEEPILCEVNSNAHFINIFNCTNVNVCDYIFEHIIEEIKKDNVYDNSTFNIDCKTKNVESKKELNKKYKAWIVYNITDYKRNSQFVKMIEEEGNLLDVDVKLIIVENLRFGIKSNRYYLEYHNKEVIENELPNFVISRTIYPLLSKQFENMGINVYNNSFVSEVCNDKSKTCQFIARLNIDMISGYFVEKRYIEYYNHNNMFEHNSVIKTVDGHGGKEVFLYNEKESQTTDNNLDINCCKTLVLEDMQDKKNIIVQPLIKGKGQDLRVYVLNNKILAAILRTSAGGFKANYSLGGDICIYNPDDNLKEIVNKIIDLFKKETCNLKVNGLSFAGIDFIIDENGKLLFNEIEDVVGSRMLYNCSNINVVRKYLEYILADMA